MRAMNAAECSKHRMLVANDRFAASIIFVAYKPPFRGNRSVSHNDHATSSHCKPDMYVIAYKSFSGCILAIVHVYHSYSEKVRYGTTATKIIELNTAVSIA